MKPRTLTIADRREAYASAYPQFPASHGQIVTEQGRQVWYATWVIGNDYRNRTTLYGAFPHGFLPRLMACFKDVEAATDLDSDPPRILHAFSGSLPRGPYLRLDLNPARRADVVGTVYDAPKLCGARAFDLVIADPPYSAADAEQYETPMVNRRRAMEALATVTQRGGHLAWLDTQWPMHRKGQWATVARILIQRSTNHRVRVLYLFERVA